MNDEQREAQDKFAEQLDRKGNFVDLWEMVSPSNVDEVLTRCVVLFSIQKMYTCKETIVHHASVNVNTGV